MAVSFNFGNAAYRMARLVQRQSATSTGYTLSLGAIIGIACGGGVLIFGLLTFILMHFARRRHKRRRKATKRLVLEDGDPEVTEAIRSTRPPHLDLSRARNDNDLEPAMRSAPVQGGMMYREDDGNTSLLPPQPGFHITGLRNSWPLVTSVPTVPLNSDGEVYNPIRDDTHEVAQQWFDQQLPGIEMRPLYSPTKTPSPTKRLSMTGTSVEHKSSSENQLSAILRSTSQRLRATKPSLPRATSVLSQISGRPPSSRAPTPDKIAMDRRMDFTSNPTEREEYEESIRSSVLNMFSNPPSPSSKRTGSASKNGNKTWVTPTKKKRKLMQDRNDSDEDSLYGDTPEAIVPAYLTSPSKPSEHRHRARMSSIDATSTTISGHNRTSTQAFGGRDIFADHPGHARMPSGDPFVDKELPAVLKTAPTRPQMVQRQPTFGNQLQPIALPPTMALQTTTGNTSPPRRRLDSDASNLDPFKWDNRSQLVVKTSPNPQKPVILGNRSSQRSNMVRISGFDQRRSVGVLEEATEEELLTPPAAVIREVRAVTDPASARSRLSSRTESPTYRPNNARSKSNSTSTSAKAYQILEPPSMCAPSPSDDSPTLGAMTPRSSAPVNPRYSATNSIYEYYTSADSAASEPQAAVIPPRSSSRKKPPVKKQSSSPFRIATTPAFVFPSPDIPGLTPTDKGDVRDHYFYTEQAQLPVSFMDNSSSSIDVPIANAAQSATSRVKGLRELPHTAARESVQASIAALRRMNSSVSAYSSATSYASDGSPTIPALRGGGISPAKEHGLHGSRNYMAIGRYMANASEERLQGNIREVGIAQQQEIRMAPASISYTVRETNHQTAIPDDEPRGRTLEKILPTGTEQQAIRPIYTSSSSSNVQDVSEDVTSEHAFRRVRSDSNVSPTNLPAPVTPQEQSRKADSRMTSAESEHELQSSGLKIQGLKLPLRDSRGSPIKSNFNENIFAVNQVQHAAVESPSRNAPYGNPGNYGNSGLKSNTNSMTSGLSGSAGVDLQTAANIVDSQPRWSNIMAQPPPGMSASRPDSQSRFAQPLAVNTTMARWGSGWESTESSPVKLSPTRDSAFEAFRPPIVMRERPSAPPSETSSARLSPIAKQIRAHEKKLSGEKQNSRKVSVNKKRIIFGEKSQSRTASWRQSSKEAKSPEPQPMTFSPSGAEDTFNWERFMGRDSAIVADKQAARSKQDAVVSRAVPAEQTTVSYGSPTRSSFEAAVREPLRKYNLPPTPPRDDLPIMAEVPFSSPRAVIHPSPRSAKSPAHAVPRDLHTVSPAQQSDGQRKLSNLLSMELAPEVPRSRERKISQSLRAGQTGRRGTAANIAKTVTPLANSIPPPKTNPTPAGKKAESPTSPSTNSNSSTRLIPPSTNAITFENWASRNNFNFKANEQQDVGSSILARPDVESADVASRSGGAGGWMATSPPPSSTSSPKSHLAQSHNYQSLSSAPVLKEVKRNNPDLYDGDGFLRNSPEKKRVGLGISRGDGVGEGDGMI